MEPSFWHARWSSERIGFHNPDVHSLLVEHWRELAPDTESGTVLVPLCGKSVDMAWIRRQGASVLGVELSDLAAKAYFQSQSLIPTTHEIGRSLLHHAAGVGILVHDWMSISQEMIAQACETMEASKPCAVYDRAALVALPPDMRLRYLDRLRQLADDSPWLLVAVEYDQSLRGGPPFSICEQEVQALHRGRDVLRLSEIESPLKDLIVNEAAYLSTPQRERGEESQH